LMQVHRQVHAIVFGCLENATRRRCCELVASLFLSITHVNVCTACDLKSYHKMETYW
jgi:hypothetical protein